MSTPITPTASDPTAYSMLEGGFSTSLGLPVATFQAGKPSSFSSSAILIESLLLTLCVGATAFVYVKGGLLRMQDSQSGINKSNEEFKRGTLGLLGVLSLYLILYTVNRSMLLANVGFDGLMTTPQPPLAVGAPTAGGAGASGSYSSPSGTKPSLSDPIWQDAINNDPAVRAQILASRVTINHGVCPSTSQTSGCTTVGDLPQETINMLGSLKFTCGCFVEVNGGTENGHATHGPGLRPVDLKIMSETDSLYSYILKNGSKINNGRDKPCDVAYSWGGFTFWDENVDCSKGNTGRHWHVS